MPRCYKPASPYFADTVFFEEDDIIMRWRQDTAEPFIPNISKSNNGARLHPLPRNWFFI